MSQRDKLKIRPHHLLCISNFLGEGYTDEFVTNFKNIVMRLNNDEVFDITNSLDSICYSCPKHNGKICEQQSKITKLDKSYKELLGINIGATFNWKQIKSLIQKKVTNREFLAICADCEWFVICKSNKISKNIHRS